ncbi:hypothetical protein DFH08DRAFT_822387 [Mycena albidolilacea]|uniref:Uncharacterized protein n=1 Tax=Mycena albidolilacea TaxID=1033008 RepID=A0AAD6Z932_9AGAR|nr:hypothetical protein DFH08DRAFT_822387 [Mycena albidolilacea]
MRWGPSQRECGMEPTRWQNGEAAAAAASVPKSGAVSCGKMPAIADCVIADRCHNDQRMALFVFNADQALSFCFMVCGFPLPLFPWRCEASVPPPMRIQDLILMFIAQPENGIPTSQMCPITYFVRIQRTILLEAVLSATDGLGGKDLLNIPWTSAGLPANGFSEHITRKCSTSQHLFLNVAKTSVISLNEMLRQLVTFKALSEACDTNKCVSRVRLTVSVLSDSDLVAFGLGTPAKLSFACTNFQRFPWEFG